MLKISERLKELRTDFNLKQSDVANILGVSRVVYTRYENGSRTIPIEYLSTLCDYYKVSMGYITGKED